MPGFEGIYGAKLGEASLKAMISKKIREAEAIITKIRDGIKSQARLHEVEFYRDLMTSFLDGKIDEKAVRKGLSALPVTMGSLPALNSELGVHVGILETHMEVEDVDGTIEIYKYSKCRKSDQDEWRDYYDVMEEIDDDPMNKGYTVSANGVAYATCPGFSTLTTDGKLVDYNPCGRRFFSSEGWHAWRCPKCKTALDDIREVSRSRGSADRQLARIVNKFKSGGIKRIIRDRNDD